jgi:hypothetical protein
MDITSLNTTYLLAIIAVLGLIIIYQFYSYRTESMQNMIDPIVTPVQLPLQPAVDIITDYDYRVMNDPLKEPGRRPPRHIIAPLIGNPYLNIPTRGWPDSFIQMGYLIDNDCHNTNKIIKLFGRETYPNSSEFEYYVEFNTENDTIKSSLDKQKRELYDDDNVYVEMLQRNYKVKLLKQRGLEYNPFLY